jgi:hypothetical protein
MYHIGAHVTSGSGAENQFMKRCDEVVRNSNRVSWRPRVSLKILCRGSNSAQEYLPSATSSSLFPVSENSPTLPKKEVDYEIIVRRTVLNHASLLFTEKMGKMK